jgi:hypothetical protein
MSSARTKSPRPTKKKIAPPKVASSTAADAGGLLTDGQNRELEALVSSQHLVATLNKELWEEWAVPPVADAPSDP